MEKQTINSQGTQKDSPAKRNAMYKMRQKTKETKIKNEQIKMEKQSIHEIDKSSQGKRQLPSTVRVETEKRTNGKFEKIRMEKQSIYSRRPG